ncbi:MAG: acyltransferase [Cytophagales bacterium]|nr:acyltransferase [Cytophaga sp.]
MKKHFNTFDALRFFAFLKVFLFHLPIEIFPLFNYLKSGGGIGVYFFFVLSGFLITYIILEEKKHTGSLHLGNFFMRRILRIWPLYYLMIGIAFATPYLLSLLQLNYSDNGYQPDWLMSLAFLENYKMIFEGVYPNVSPLGAMWSLCVEEHFYIVWGILLSVVSIKKTPIVIIGSILLSALSIIVFIQYDVWPLDISTNLIYFSFGAIPAYLLSTNEARVGHAATTIPFIYMVSWIVCTIVYVTVAPNIAYPFHELVDAIMLSLLFSGIIFLVITGGKFKIEDDNVFSRLGKYTYGMYLYHVLVIAVLIQVFIKNKWAIDTSFQAILFLCSALIMTVSISVVSYELFEKQFLKLKRYFYK